MSPVAHVFVYYRPVPDTDPRLEPAIGHLLARVAELTGIAGRYMRREDDPGTWMEVYEDVGDSLAFCGTLARLAAECGLDTLLGPDVHRHVERFVEHARCA
jgi:hypothetical protein